MEIPITKKGERNAKKQCTQAACGWRWWDGYHSLEISIEFGVRIAWPECWKKLPTLPKS
jgi:hypothetical protein